MYSFERGFPTHHGFKLVDDFLISTSPFHRHILIQDFFFGPHALELCWLAGRELLLLYVRK